MYTPPTTHTFDQRGFRSLKRNLDSAFSQRFHEGRRPSRPLSTVTVGRILFSVLDDKGAAWRL